MSLPLISYYTPEYGLLPSLVSILKHSL